MAYLPSADQPDYRTGLLKALGGAAPAVQPGRPELPPGVQIPAGGMSWGDTQAFQRQVDAGNAGPAWDAMLQKLSPGSMGALGSQNWIKQPTGPVKGTIAGDPGVPTGAEPGGYAGPAAGGTPSPFGGIAAGAASIADGLGPKQSAGPYASFAGFDGSKFGGDSKPGSKYTKDAGVYSQAIGANVDFGRGNLGGLVDFYHKDGFPAATAVGDDKIDPDGPGPMAPIDVIRSDGTKVYQNTTGNPQWEAQYGGGAGGGVIGSGHPDFTGSSISPLLQSSASGNLSSALSAFPQASDNSFLQQLIAQLMAGGK